MKKQVKETPEAPGQARERLTKMGPMSKNELITTATICGAVVLWIMGDAWGVPAVLAAMLGLSTLLLTGGCRVDGCGWVDGCSWVVADGSCLRMVLACVWKAPILTPVAPHLSHSPPRRPELARLPGVPSRVGLPRLVRWQARGPG